MATPRPSTTGTHPKGDSPCEEQPRRRQLAFWRKNIGLKYGCAVLEGTLPCFKWKPTGKPPLLGLPSVGFPSDVEYQDTLISLKGKYIRSVKCRSEQFAQDKYLAPSHGVHSRQARRLGTASHFFFSSIPRSWQPGTAKDTVSVLRPSVKNRQRKGSPQSMPKEESKQLILFPTGTVRNRLLSSVLHDTDSSHRPILPCSTASSQASG